MEVNGRSLLDVKSLFKNENDVSCTCPAGPMGAQGPAGPAGADGADGADGPDSAPGLPGLNGVNGTDGAPGPGGQTLTVVQRAGSPSNGTILSSTTACLSPSVCVGCTLPAVAFQVTMGSQANTTCTCK